MADKAALFQNMYEYIKNLDEAIKTDQPLYEKRLAVCADCNYLNDGLCGACGCFVEMRAALKKNCCPYNKWGADV